MHPAFLNWIKNYSWSTLRADFISGLVVSLVLIPQSMAYAQLAGLPVYYGLYASLLPPMVAAMMGSSNQLATGPVAVVSLMCSASLEPLATAGSDAYVAYAIILALVVGIFQVLLGTLRLGMLVNFLAHPVVLGFTNAAAIIIATSQLSKVFGVTVDEAEHHYETIINVIKAAIHYTHLPTLLLSILSIVIMVILKKFYPRIPNVLIAVIITTTISWYTGFKFDKTVDVCTLESNVVIDKISIFNKMLADVEQLSKERTEQTTLLAKTTHDFGKLCEAALDTRSEIDKINLEIRETKHSIIELRRELRDEKFYLVSDGTKSVYYPESELPAGAKTDGRIWHLKVSNSPIKMDKLSFTGGGSVIGTIPKGLPAPKLPQFNLSAMLSLLSSAVIITLLGFMEAISIAKAIAAKTGQRLDPNQELIGQGISNIVSSFTQGYPVSGSFSRSAVNVQAGAMTGMSSVFTSIFVGLTLLFLTPLLYHLPQSVLAAVIMMAVIGLVNVKGIMHAWHAQRYDGAIAVISFIATLAFAPHLDNGIILGVGLSIGHYLYRNMKPRVAVMSRSMDGVMRDANIFMLPQCEYIAIIRFDGSLFFANTSYLEDKLLEHAAAKKNLRHIIIVADGINALDATGEETLSMLVDRFRDMGITISFSGIKKQVMEVMERTHLTEKIDNSNIYRTLHEAISSIHSQLHADGVEENCPLNPFTKQA